MEPILHVALILCLTYVIQYGMNEGTTRPQRKQNEGSTKDYRRINEEPTKDHRRDFMDFMRDRPRGKASQGP